MLDVSMILNDPLISDTFDVRRQAEVIGANGRTTVTPTSFPAQRGIVVPMGGEMNRRDDGQLVPHIIKVQTAFALRDARTGFQPDIVIWNGTEYLVVEALPFQRLAGYTQAKAVSTTATDDPQ